MDSLLVRYYVLVMQIEHDKDEPPRDRTGNWIYWACPAVLALLWWGYLAFNNADWWALAVGGGSGMFLAVWAIEITGNKVPPWMRR